MGDAAAFTPEGRKSVPGEYLVRSISTQDQEDSVGMKIDATSAGSYQSGEDFEAYDADAELSDSDGNSESS